MNKAYIKEITFTIVAFFFLLFVQTNVNQTLGTVYLAFTLGILAFLIIGITIFDKDLHITFQKSPGRTFNALLVGLGGWITLLIASVFVLDIVNPASSNSISSVLSLMGATTPAFSNSKIINLFAFGVVIPFVETTLWARAMEFFADRMNVVINKNALKKVKYWILMIILSFVFVLFHATAKGIENTSALIIVGIMMLITLLMITWKEETRQAVYMHVFANTVATYLALFAVGSLTLGI